MVFLPKMKQLILMEILPTIMMIISNLSIMRLNYWETQLQMVIN